MEENEVEGGELMNKLNSSLIIWVHMDRPM